MIHRSLLLFVIVTVTAANIQDRDGACALIKAIRYRFPWLRHLFADSAHAGPQLREAIAGHGDWAKAVTTFRFDQAAALSRLRRISFPSMAMAGCSAWASARSLRNLSKDA